MEIAKQSHNVCKQPEHRVRFRSLGDSGLIFQLLFWIQKPADRGRIVDEINSEIYNKFNSENIVFPYPQRTIHLQSNDFVNTKK